MAKKVHPQKKKIVKNDTHTISSPSMSDSSEEEIDESIINEDENQNMIPEESKISKTLSDQTTRTVVMLVLCLLFLLPVCTSETYVDVTKIHK